MRAIVQGKNILFDNCVISFDSLFSDSTIEAANKYATDYYDDICVVNELYEEYVLPSFDIEIFFEKYSIEEIDLQCADEKLKTLFACVCRKNQTIAIKGRFNKTIHIRSAINRIAAFFFLLLKQLEQVYVPIRKLSESVVFVRSNATKKKYSKIRNVDQLDEKSPGVGTIYKQIRLFKRIALLFKAVHQERKYETEIREYLKKNDLSECIPLALFHYSNRLIHTAFYCFVQNEIVRQGNWVNLYTGNNLDRFAINEEKIARDNHMKLICIPHGIEYGYRYPKCFVGDVFYTTSKNAASCLNRLYDTCKFVFSPDIVEKMFKIDGTITREKRIVYFSEPREFYVNIEILTRLHEILSTFSIDLFLKLHPLDNPENYKGLFDIGIKEIKDYKDAICGNICLSRKSTSLLEAIYNGSSAVAILINEKDSSIFDSFPSLSDDRIMRFSNIDEAGRCAVKCINP